MNITEAKIWGLSQVCFIKFLLFLLISTAHLLGIISFLSKPVDLAPMALAATKRAATVQVTAHVTSMTAGVRQDVLQDTNYLHARKVKFYQRDL